MSAGNFLTIDFDYINESDLRKLLKANRLTATHVCLRLKAAADFPVLSLDGCPLLRSEAGITKWFGFIAKKLPSLTHVTIDFCRCIMYDEEWFRASNFPVEALNSILCACSKTLVSLVTDAQDAIPLEGSTASLQRTIKNLGKMRRLKELDLAYFAWIIVPEIHTSQLPAGHEIDRGYVIDPAKEQLDPAMLISSINKLTTLEKLSLRMEGCDLDMQCSVLGHLAETSTVKCVNLRFYSNRWYRSDSDEWTHRANLLLEAAVETKNVTLEDITVSNVPKWNEKVAFALKINKVGRKELLEDVNDYKLWWKTLFEQSNDCQTTFFLLSTNLSAYLPAMLDGAKHISANSEASVVPVSKKARTE